MGEYVLQPGAIQITTDRLVINQGGTLQQSILRFTGFKFNLRLHLAWFGSTRRGGSALGWASSGSLRESVVPHHAWGLLVGLSIYVIQVHDGPLNRRHLPAGRKDRAVHPTHLVVLLVVGLLLLWLAARQGRMGRRRRRRCGHHCPANIYWVNLLKTGLGGKSVRY